MIKLKDIKENYKNKAKVLTNITDENDISIDALRSFTDILTRDHFDIAFIGEFTAGKSTLINALLQSDILPTNLQPSTARITKISYAKEPKIILNYVDGQSEEKDYSPELIKSLSVIHKDELKRVSSIELYYPSNLLKHGIRFIDTPGTNDTDAQRIEVTYKLIPSVDAVVYVTIYPISASNLKVFEEHIVKNGIVNLFIILNKTDLIQEMDEVIDSAQNYFSDLLGTKVKIYPLSSLDFLEGVIENDKELIDKSNFQNFLDELNTFILSSDKYENLSKQIQYKFNNLKKQIIELLNIKINSLEMPDDVFKERKDELSSKLVRYISEAKQLQEDIHTEFNKLNNKLYESLDKLIMEIIQNVDMLLDQYNADINILMKQIEYSIKNKYEMWQNKNRILVDQYIASIYKETKLRLGQVTHNISNSINQFAIVKTDRNIISPSDTKEINSIDEGKARTMISVASIGTYVGLASAGITLAPVAMLILPIGIYLMQKNKRAEMAKIKESLITKLQQASIDFKNEVTQNIKFNETEIVKMVEDTAISFSSEIKMQIEKVEQEKDKMQSDIDNQVLHLKEQIETISKL